LLGCDNGVDCDTGGKERRRQWRPNWQTSKNMDGPHIRHRSNDARDRPPRRFLSRGNGAPEFRFPHLFPSEVFGEGNQGLD